MVSCEKKINSNTARWRYFTCWFDNTKYAYIHESTDQNENKIDYLRLIPFFGLHLGCLCVLWVGISLTSVLVAIFLYAIRMFAITGFYHRYFSHRAFRTSRLIQFIFAMIAVSSGQRGPLWWASHHRHHHVHSDAPEDAHSAHQHGFLWSHTGWFMARKNFNTKTNRIPDFARYPELKFLDRYDVIVPLLLAISIYVFGEILTAFAPSLETNGLQLLIWGFFISTVVLYHATFSINSLAHRFGKRRYATKDDSRNNFYLALLTFGEGWHNNHHHFPGSARQGFYWWEIDLTYYGLRLLAALGLIWDLREIPSEFLNAKRIMGTKK
jgi:stearoyl-CoA desaturase (delta-9 desaturase)